MGAAIEMSVSSNWTLKNNDSLQDCFTLVHNESGTYSSLVIVEIVVQTSRITFSIRNNAQSRVNCIVSDLNWFECSHIRKRMYSPFAKVDRVGSHMRSVCDRVGESDPYIHWNGTRDHGKRKDERGKQSGVSIQRELHSESAAPVFGCPHPLLVHKGESAPLGPIGRVCGNPAVHRSSRGKEIGAGAVPGEIDRAEPDQVHSERLGDL